MNKTLKKIFLASLFSMPIFSYAAELTDFIDASFGIVTQVLTPLAFTLCLFYFFWGVAKYIREGASSPDAAKEGKRIMGWGIFALFIVTTIWGIVVFIRSELGIPDIDTVERDRIEAVNSTLIPMTN